MNESKPRALEDNIPTPISGKATFMFYITALFHFFITVFNSLYILIRQFIIKSGKYDWVYFTSVGLNLLSWILYPGGECLVSDFEKKEIDPKYKSGTHPHLHPYLSFIMFGNDTLAGLFIKITMPLAYISIICMLIIYRHSKYISIGIISLLAYIIIMSTRDGKVKGGS
jgi:hypothetical protein